MRKLGRRDFVRAAGYAGAAALVPLLRGSSAIAQGDIPLRFVMINGADGSLWREWEPRPIAGMPTYGRNSFTLGPAMEPLLPYLPDMIAFENLDMHSTHVDPTTPDNAHLDGGTHFLTGANRLTGALPGAISIDQFIARELTAQGVLTALPSMEMAIQAGGPYNDGWTGPVTTWSSSGAGEHVGALVIPHEIFARLFPSSNMEMPDTGVVERMQGIFEFSRNEHTNLQSRLPSEDRMKIQQHLDVLSDLEQRRLIRLSGGSRRSLWPDPSIVASAADLDWSYNAPRETVWRDRWEISSDINMRLAAAALHADVTRVMSLHLEGPPDAVWGYTGGMLDSTDAHDLTHKVNDRSLLNAQSMDPVARNLLIAEKHAMLGKVRLFLDELARLTEVDGSRLLDHTVVMFTSHIADGSHSTDSLPWFTIGGLGGRLRTGQLIQFPRTVDPVESWVTHGRAHNDLFLTIAQALGIEATTFGNPEVCTGPITEMLT